MIFDEMEFGPYDKAEQKARRAFELYEDGNMSQALDELETALEINPACSSLHFNKALTLDAISRFEDAITEYETALQLDPDDLEILNSLAVDYTRTGQYDLGIDTFEHIEQLDPTFEPCYCNRIITYTEMGLHDLAEQMFYLAQQIKPDCALCYYNIGNSLFARGEYKKAIRCWLRAAELDPTHPQINYRIAQAYWSDGEFERSREHFLMELRTNPGDIDVIFDFGLFLLKKGDLESAKEKFNRILELKPDFGAALFYLGEIAFNNGDYERAVGLYNEALEKDGTLPGPGYRLAQHALLKGRHAEARAYLMSEMKLTLEDADTLVSMGSMFLTIGDLGCATHCMLRAVDIDCANADAYYYLGVINAIKGDLEDAAELFAHTLDIRSDHVATLRDWACVCLEMGRLTEAAEKIQKVRSLDGGDPQLKKLERRLAVARAKQRITDVLGQFGP
ncbi:MAG: tetratricopeptide repeat protein [Planctomycetota bacterium]